MARKPKPSYVKLVKGTTRPAREGGEEPVPPDGAIVRPGYLQGRAASLWDEYRPALEAMGTLTVVDAPNFAVWCSLTAAFEENPRDTKAALMAQARLLASSLGMDASARAKLGTGGKAKPDPADKYFNREK